MTQYEEGKTLLERFNAASGNRGHTRAGVEAVLEYEAAKVALARFVKRQARANQKMRSGDFTSNET